MNSVIKCLISKKSYYDGAFSLARLKPTKSTSADECSTAHRCFSSNHSSSHLKFQRCFSLSSSHLNPSLHRNVSSSHTLFSSSLHSSSPLNPSLHRNTSPSHTQCHVIPLRCSSRRLFASSSRSSGFASSLSELTYERLCRVRRQVNGDYNATY